MTKTKTNSSSHVLSIDTSHREHVTVSLNGNKLSATQEVPRRAQITLQLIDTLLTTHKISLQDLTSLEVVLEGESFTGIRVGVTVANALSYALHIPVNGEKTGVYAEPRYSPVAVSGKI